MKLLVGLGNPGPEYARHRHNVGFMAVEAIGAAHGFQPWRRRFSGHMADGDIGGERAILLKPDTYMNESGRSVGEALRFLKLDVGDLIVFHDELDIEPGRVKVKVGGGNAGHNGLRSISAHQGNEYTRVRIGIGHPGHKDLVSGYVLHDFAKAERAWLDPLLADMARGVPHLLVGNADRFAAALSGDAKPEPHAVEAKPPAAKHPSGERANKQKSALAENLRKWMDGKKGR